jgi:hypothetical protein
MAKAKTAYIAIRASAWSRVDYPLRLLFFAVAPFAIVFVASLFSVTGALIDCSLALIIFVLGDQVRSWSTRSRLLTWLLDTALEFEGFYRKRPPRPFLYYLFYPLLFPYWLISRDARREFFVFRGYTLGGLFILLATLGWQYFTRFPPELTLRQFLPQVWLSLLVEMFLALALLMPIATSFVWYHGRGHRYRLYVLLAVGCLSSVIAIYQVVSRRDPVVSFLTNERVTLRTNANKRKAYRTLVNALRAGRKALLKSRDIEGDGKVMGEPLEAARVVMKQFYKSDEVLAFDLWASPRKRPRIIVLYFEGSPSQKPIWVAVDGYGNVVRHATHLPKGAFEAMRAASDGTEDLLEALPEELPSALEFDDSPSAK